MLPECSVAGGDSAFALPTSSVSMVILIACTSSVITICRGMVAFAGLIAKFGNSQVTAPVIWSTFRAPAEPPIAVPSSVACSPVTAPHGVFLSSYVTTTSSSLPMRRCAVITGELSVASVGAGGSQAVRAMHGTRAARIR